MWSRNKITRGLSQLAKTFITKWLKKDKDKKRNIFEHLDFLLKHHFPTLYRYKRIEALGGIGKIILMIKFDRDVQASKYLKTAEKRKILGYGRQFTQWKNKWSTSSERKSIWESGPVLMGKILYSSSEKMKEEFWAKIFWRRNQIISDRENYMQTLIDDIEAIPIEDKVDVDKILSQDF